MNNLIEIVSALDDEQLLDDGATTWTAENLCEYLLNTLDEENKVEYSLTDRGIHRIKPDGYIETIPEYMFVDSEE